MADTAVGSGLPAVDPSVAARKGGKPDRQDAGSEAGGFGTVLDRTRDDDHAARDTRQAGNSGKDGREKSAEREKATAEGDHAAAVAKKTAIIDLRLNGKAVGIDGVAGDGSGLAALQAQAAAGEAAIKVAKLPKRSALPEQDAETATPDLPATDAKEADPGKALQGVKAHNKPVRTAAMQTAAEQPADPAKRASAESDVLTMLAAGDAAGEAAPDGASPGNGIGAEKHVPDMGAIAAMASPVISKADGGSAKPGEGAARTGALKAAASTSDETGEGAAKTEEPASGRTFRFARADGRGQTLDMRIGTSAREAPPESRNSPVETVTVVDARRYLALSQNSNTVVNSLAGDPEWTSAMQPSNALSNAATMASTGKVVNTLKIQIHPMTLGTVTATMRLAGDELRVDLAVETVAAYRQLSDDQRGMVDALRAQGFAVDQVSVTLVSPSDKSDSAGTQTNGQNAAFGQQAQDGNASPRRDDRYAAQGNGKGGEAASEDRMGSSAAGGGARSGDLYL